MDLPGHKGLFVSSAPLILASASPRRKALLEDLGIDFTIEIAHINEEPNDLEEPDAFVRRLAVEKAGAIGRHHSNAWILAADTIVVLDGAVLNKPADRQEALAMLLHCTTRLSSCWCSRLKPAITC